MTNKSLPETMTEAQFNSIIPDAVSVPYPYSRNLDGNGPSHLPGELCSNRQAGMKLRQGQTQPQAESYVVEY